MGNYQDAFPWVAHHEEHFLVHDDGAVSMLILWDGIDMEMQDDDTLNAKLARTLRLLHDLPAGLVYEFHLWRDYDDTLARRYVERMDNAPRIDDFSRWFKTSLAEHLGRYAMSNTVGIVLTAKPDNVLPIRVKKRLSNPIAAGKRLLAAFAKMKTHLAGARIADKHTYAARILKSYDRSRAARIDMTLSDDSLLSVNEQLIREKPEREGDLLRFGNKEYVKTLMFYMQPSASPDWMLFLASLSCPLHISHIVAPMNTKAALRASETHGEITEGLTSSRDREQASGKISSMLASRSHVRDNNLRYFSNCFILTLYGDKDNVLHTSDAVASALEAEPFVDIRSNWYIQLPYLKVSLPGHGYLCPHLRPDDSEQVANLLPVQVYSQGDPEPDILRLAVNGALVGYRYLHNTLNHLFCAAKSTSGKTVEKCIEIAETYPAGINWYVAEVGVCYRDTIQALGGPDAYIRIDPRESVINPFPLYSVADVESSEPLASDIVIGTTESIAFLLKDNAFTLNDHESAVAQAALKLMYLAPDGSARAPTMEHYLNALGIADDYAESDAQRAAAKTMHDKLSSFLSTEEGRIFTQQDNVVFKDDIFGVDLKEVSRVSKKLMMIFLVFVGLRYSQMAFANRKQSFVMLDELHAFVDDAPEVVGGLISGISRMGRKDAGAIQLLSQETHEMEAYESAVINQMQHKVLLYRPDEHDYIAKRLNVPPRPLELWRNFANPDGQTFRPCLRGVGDDYHNLFLTLPEDLLLTASSDPAILDFKDAICRQTNDPFERLDLLKRKLHRA